MGENNIKDTDGFKEVDGNGDGKLSLSEIESRFGGAGFNARGSEPVQKVDTAAMETSNNRVYDLKDDASIRAAIENTPLPETLNLGTGQAQDIKSFDEVAPSAGRGQGVEQLQR